MSALTSCVTPCRHISLRFARPITLGSNLTSAWSPSPVSYQHTTIRTVLQLSRREKALQQIQATSGLLSDKEKQTLAKKEAKRAQFAERMQTKHGDNWQAVVEEMDRAELAARQNGDKPAFKKKNRWSQKQKDEHAAKKAELRAAKDAWR